MKLMIDSTKLHHVRTDSWSWN